MNIIEDTKLDFDDVLIRPSISSLRSRKEVNLHRNFTRQSMSGIPIISANMDTVGTMEMAKVLTSEAGAFATLHKFYTPQQVTEFFDSLKGTAPNRVFVTIGTTEADKQRLIDIMENCTDVCRVSKLCIDIANGYSPSLIETVKWASKRYPQLTIMAGNVVTNDMVAQLVNAGAKIVKVGIGSGSGCTSRKVTGVGYPQLSAIVECADTAHGLNALICGDGGCRTSGDIAKALGAGADMVMLGGMLAGHKESFDDFDINTVENGKVPFYGMASDTAIKKYYKNQDFDYKTSEGRNLSIPYKGEVKNTIKDIYGGLRSTCTYVGAKEIKDLRKCTTFVKVRRQLNTYYENFED